MLPEHYTPPQLPVQVQPKSPGLAILLSFLLPGLGSMYASRAGKGALIRHSRRDPVPGQLERQPPRTP